jgi:homoserine kinase
LSIHRAGTLGGLAVPAERDRLYVGFRAACRVAGRSVPAGLTIEANSDIPIGRGLGSSAAATVAGAVAANTLLGLGLSQSELLALCAEIDGHADNVAAALCGGARLVVQARPQPVVAPLDVHESLAFVIALPDFPVETARARSALPSRLSWECAVNGISRAAALTVGLARGDGALLRAALDDVVHVPSRKRLVPGYDAVTRAACAAGAFGATLSGSGSAVLAVVPRAVAAWVADAMAEAWRGRGVAVETIVFRRPARGHDVWRRRFADTGSGAPGRGDSTLHLQHREVAE